MHGHSATALSAVTGGLPQAVEAPFYPDRPKR